MSRSTAIRGVTANIFKRTLFLAAWTYLWWCWDLNGVPTAQALPKRIHVFYCRCVWLFDHNFTISSFIPKSFCLVIRKPLHDISLFSLIRLSRKIRIVRKNDKEIKNKLIVSENRHQPGFIRMNVQTTHPAHNEGIYSPAGVISHHLTMFLSPNLSTPRHQQLQRLATFRQDV